MDINTYYVKGDVCREGAVTLRAGMTLGQLLEEAGGMKDGKALKAVQLGGPSGTLLGADSLELGLDMKSLTAKGLRRGDGVVTFLDENRCIVDVVCRFERSTQLEFCGRCVSCREGNKRMSELLTELLHGSLSRADFVTLQDIGEMVQYTSFCALGKGSFSTLEQAIRLFPEEFEAHLAGRCGLCEGEERLPVQPGHISHDRKLIRINPDKCRGCSKCSRLCHAQAISGVIKQPFVIDPAKCVRCYSCMENCFFGAIEEVDING